MKLLFSLYKVAQIHKPCYVVNYVSSCCRFPVAYICQKLLMTVDKVKTIIKKKAVLSQGNRAMPQLFVSV